MKRMFLIASCIMGTFFTTSFAAGELSSTSKAVFLKTDYCEGWEDGYCEGWKDVKGKYSICPIAPICPVPKIGERGFKDGYNRGFKRGMKDASK